MKEETKMYSECFFEGALFFLVFRHIDLSVDRKCLNAVRIRSNPLLTGPHVFVFFYNISKNCAGEPSRWEAKSVMMTCKSSHDK